MCPNIRFYTCVQIFDVMFFYVYRDYGLWSKQSQEVPHRFWISRRRETVAAARCSGFGRLLQLTVFSGLAGCCLVVLQDITAGRPDFSEPHACSCAAWNTVNSCSSCPLPPGSGCALNKSGVRERAEIWGWFPRVLNLKQTRAFFFSAAASTFLDHLCLWQNVSCDGSW